MKLLALAFALLASVVVPPAEASTAYELKIFNQNGQLVKAFTPFPEAAPASVVAADLGRDGTAEIIVGSGAGIKPLVRVFRQDGSLINEFLAYGEAFRGGVNVAACDLDGDGQSEIVTGAGYTGGPHVRAFKADGTPTKTSFFAYDTAFRGGVNVACGDLTGDGQAEIVTGAGITGGAQVKVFSPQGTLLSEASAGPTDSQTGTLVTLGDTNGDDQLEILSSPMAFASPSVSILVWSEAGLKLRQNVVVGTQATFGTPLAAFDIDNDGVGELAVSAGAFGSSAIKVFEIVGTTTPSIETSINTSSSTVLLANLHDKSVNNLIALAGSTGLANASADKYIKVDLSEQRLTAYENGIPVKTFLVSTGTKGWPTPLGKTTVTAKIPVKHYGMYLGPGNAANYSLPNVKWNLRFREHYYIHSAYWHNNFGRPMSHGCVNMSIPDAEWVYHWANVGTPVEIIN